MLKSTEAKVASPINERLLDDKLAILEKAQPWNSRVISKLELLIRTGDDDSLYRINPIRFAAERGMREAEANALFLHATKVGLFEIDWHLICPVCAHVVKSFKTLDELHDKFQCNLCWAENRVSLDDYIQVTFTLAPQVRELVYHHPESLSAEDLYLKTYWSKGVRALPRGEEIQDFWRSISKLYAYLAPGESRTIEFEAPSGVLHLRDVPHNSGPVLVVHDPPSPEVQSVRFQIVEGKFRALDRQLAPQTAHVGLTTFKFDQFGELSTGRLRVSVENLMDETIILGIVHAPDGSIPENLDFGLFLSGKQLLSTQTFLDLFRSVSTPGAEGLEVKDLTYLFTDLKGSTSLYDAIGDPKAFYLVRQHFETLTNAVVRNHGAIVKTIGDAVMATFLSPADAVRAAVDMLDDIAAFNQAISERLSLKIGIHKGHSIAVTLNDRLDYFGQSVNIASRIQELADANEIFISEHVYHAPGVKEALAAFAVAPQQTIVKGVSAELQVYKVQHVHPQT